MLLSWDSLNADITGCTRCGLCSGILHKVPGQGRADADIMLIGEGPGAEEDKQGLAFVGAAGQLLTKMLGAIDLDRQNVFIANIVKCRPPKNRVPEPNEAQACLPHLRAQFALVRPKIVILLGATACRYILGDSFRLTRQRGQWVEKKGVYFMPTYHPAALLRDESKKRDAWTDLKAVREKMKELGIDE